jgi:hypothetical protein
MSLRTDIVADIITQTKTVAAFSNRVYDWMSPLPTRTLPYVLVLPEREDLANAEFGGGTAGSKTIKVLTVTLLVFVSFDVDSSVTTGWVDLEGHITDIQQAILAVPGRNVAAVEDTTLDSWEILGPEEDQPNRLRCQLTATVKYRHDFADPETNS